MKKRIANICAISTWLVAVSLGIPALSNAQQSTAAGTALTHTVNIYEEKGVSISYPDGWSVTQPMVNMWAIANVPAGQMRTVTPSVQLLIGYLERIDHADAVSQLAEYANESRIPSTFLAIGGWPALQRVQLITRPQPGEEELQLNPDQQMVHITTAVAAGKLLFRLDAGLPSDADQALKDLVLAIGQSLVFSSTGDPAQVQQELNHLKSLPQRPAVLPSAAAPPASAPLLPNLFQAAPIFPTTQFPNFLYGEQEVAVSNNGTNIVVARQGQSFASVDGGQTFSGPVALIANGDGDSSLAFGQSGNFYHAKLFGGACPAGNSCVEIAALTVTNVGGAAVQTVGTLFNAATCPTTGPACIDQEHIAADRVNAAANNLDNVYLAVRVSTNGNFGPGSSVANVACSPDSGAHWSPLFPLENSSDYPRVTVGSDGFFYVVFANNGAGSGNIRIDKFNSCPALNTTTVPPTVPAMTRAIVTTTVTAFLTFGGCGVQNIPNVQTGFGGLDRCNNGNILSSPTIAVDDTKPNHVYVAWAQSNMTGSSENIEVIDSLLGGTDWPNTGRPPVTVNSPGTAKRFMPWVCATGGKAFVTWYDRGAATAANNDLTDYRAASAGLDATNTLVRSNDDFKISGASDPQCAQWPFAPRSVFDSENCSVQPQNAGVCKVPKPPNPDNISTNTRCDFLAGAGVQCGLNPTTGVQEICSTGGGGPKYGDYNGNACGLGRLHTVFASGVSPLGVPLGANVINNFFNSFVVTPTPTTLTYTGDTTADFDDPVATSATLTLSGTSSPVVGQTIKFTIGTQNCSGVTDAFGAASCSMPIIINQIPGSYTVTASFAGAGNLQANSASSAFTITKEETTLTYTGPTLVLNGQTASLSAVLTEDTAPGIANRTVNFTLGSGAGAQPCQGALTNSAGADTCNISPVAQPQGPVPVTVSFAGDSFYLPASMTQTIVARVPWQPGVTYHVGDVVIFNGLLYVCRQTHTSELGWEPPNVYALWARVESDTGGVWAPQVIYQAGDIVTFQGHTYKAIQGHQSEPGWEPPNVPALWQKLQ